MLALVGKRLQLRQQARLADARLAIDGQPPWATGIQGVERVRQLLELTVAPDKWPSGEVV